MQIITTTTFYLRRLCIPSERVQEEEFFVQPFALIECFKITSALISSSVSFPSPGVCASADERGPFTRRFHFRNSQFYLILAEAFHFVRIFGRGGRGGGIRIEL